MAFIQSGYDVKDLNGLSSNFYKTLGSSLGISDVTPKKVELDLSQVDLAEIETEEVKEADQFDFMN
jgi:hypothetical protein